MHVHIAGLGHDGGGCFVTDVMKDSYKFDYYRGAFGVNEALLKQHGDQELVKRLVKMVDEAGHIDCVVILALDLPLLSHAGQERSFADTIDEYVDPKRLSLPLSLGVKVIASHIATTGESHSEDNYQRILTMFEQYPNLYTDISSLTQVNKLGYINKAIVEPRQKGHLVYGSDFLLVNMGLVSPYYFTLNLTFEQMWSQSKIDNLFERDVALKQALGLPSAIFTCSASLLNISPENEGD